MSERAITEDLSQAHFALLKTQRHIRTTLCIGTFAFPLLLGWGGKLLLGQSLLGSMSAYYNTEMRNLFVGMLWFISALLFLYKGYSRAENILLKLAALCALAVACFPMSCISALQPRAFHMGFPTTCLYQNEWTLPPAHHLATMIFFLSGASICVFCAKNTLVLLGEDAAALRLRARFRALYIIYGAVIFLHPLLFFALIDFMRHHRGFPVYYFIETGITWIFAAYWLTKNYELHLISDSLERKNPHIFIETSRIMSKEQKESHV
jgi:hypothetical protein